MSCNTEGAPPGFFISADSNQVKAACFHTLSEVRILRELGAWIGPARLRLASSAFR